MTLRVGVVGAGIMGADHAKNIGLRTARAALVAIADPDGARLAKAAREAGATRTHADPRALIADPEVDAVVVVSPDETHTEFVLACIAAGKPVLCEKPLAPTAAECLRILAAETKLGRRLVQVGFMRRFDPGYVAMKEALASGRIGRPLMLHCVHRNSQTPPGFDAAMLMTSSAVHEIDITRWLLGRELVRVRALKVRASGHGDARDPLLLIFEDEAGVLIDLEIFVHDHYGYDVRAELVGELGTISLVPPIDATTRLAGQQSFGFAPDWRGRFAAAYRNELQAWVDSIQQGGGELATAWDGYVATAGAAACQQALQTGQQVEIKLEPRPTLYR